MRRRTRPRAARSCCPRATSTRRRCCEEALAHLTDDGMVVMQFGEKDYAARPNRTARLAATAREAYDDRGHRPVRRTHRGRHVDGRGLPLRRLDDDDEDDAVHRGRARPDRGQGRRRCPTRRPATCPVEPATTRRPGEPAHHAADDAGADAFIACYPYDVRPITDNRPFFWHFTPFREVIGHRRPRWRTSTSRSASASGCSSCCSAWRSCWPRCSCSDRSWSCRDDWRALPDKATTAPIFGAARSGLHRLRDHADPAVLAVPRLPDLLADGDAHGDPAVHRHRRARQPALARSARTDSSPASAAAIVGSRCRSTSS